VEKIRNQKPEVRSLNQNQESGVEPESHPLKQWTTSNGWTMSMQMPIFKGVLRADPLSNFVGQRASGQMMMSRPLILVPPVHRMIGVDANAYFQRGF
jgi:hypothetical protein